MGSTTSPTQRSRSELLAIFDAATLKRYDSVDVAHKDCLTFLAQDFEHVGVTGKTRRGEQELLTLDYSRLTAVLWGVCKSPRRSRKSLRRSHDPLTVAAISRHRAGGMLYSCVWLWQFCTILPLRRTVPLCATSWRPNLLDRSQLQPDLLIGRVKSASSSACCFQPYKACGAVCVQLQPGKASACSVLENGPHHASSGSPGDRDQSAIALCLVLFNLQQRVQPLVRDLQPSDSREDAHVGVGVGGGLKLRRRHAGGEDGFCARGDLQRSLSPQACSAARQGQQSVANPGPHCCGVQTLVKPAGRVDGASAVVMLNRVLFSLS